MGFLKSDTITHDHIKRLCKLDFGITSVGLLWIITSFSEKVFCLLSTLLVMLLRNYLIETATPRSKIMSSASLASPTLTILKTLTTSTTSTTSTTQVFRMNIWKSRRSWRRRRRQERWPTKAGTKKSCRVSSNKNISI